MATYILRIDDNFGIASKTSAWVGVNSAAVCSAVDADIITQANRSSGTGFVSLIRFCDGVTSVIGSHLLRFQCFVNGAAFFLDGAGTEVVLPVGFVVDSVILRVDKSNGLDSGSYYINASSHLFMQFSQSIEEEIASGSVGGTPQASFTRPTTFPAITALNLLLDGFGLRYTATTQDVVKFRNVRITGNYSILSFSW